GGVLAAGHKLAEGARRLASSMRCRGTTAIVDKAEVGTDGVRRPPFNMRRSENRSATSRSRAASSPWGMRTESRFCAAFELSRIFLWVVPGTALETRPSGRSHFLSRPGPGIRMVERHVARAGDRSSVRPSRMALRRARRGGNAVTCIGMELAHPYRALPPLMTRSRNGPQLHQRQSP